MGELETEPRRRSPKTRKRSRRLKSYLTRAVAAGAVGGVALALGAGSLRAWQEAAPPPSGSLVQLVAAQATRPCDRIEVVGLRGHGDSMATAAGLGADVLALTQRVESMQPAGDVSVYALPYAQAPAVLGTPISVLRDLQPGADLLAAYLQRRVARCPGEAQIVIGQSEGAAVVHLAWAGIARYVSAAVLFGDPLHVGWTSYDQPGSDTAQGQLAGWTGIGRPAWLFQVADPIPAGTAGRVRSYCLPDDRVCAFNLLDTRPDAHLTYRLNRSLVAGGPGVLTEALGFVDSSLMRPG